MNWSQYNIPFNESESLINCFIHLFWMSQTTVGRYLANKQQNQPDCLLLFRRLLWIGNRFASLGSWVGSNTGWFFPVKASKAFCPSGYAFLSTVSIYLHIYPSAQLLAFSYLGSRSRPLYIRPQERNFKFASRERGISASEIGARGSKYRVKYIKLDTHPSRCLINSTTSSSITF
jgi:hypothetical protein